MIVNKSLQIYPAISFEIFTGLKNLFTIFCGLFLFSACGQTQVTTANAIETPSSRLNLVVDSTQLQAFCKEQKIGNSASALLQRFYKSRSYQYAWFTNDGMADYALAFWRLHNEYIHTFADTSLLYKNIHQYIDQLLNDGSHIKLSSDKIASSI